MEDIIFDEQVYPFADHHDDIVPSTDLAATLVIINLPVPPSTPLVQPSPVNAIDSAPLLQTSPITSPSASLGLYLVVDLDQYGPSPSTAPTSTMQSQNSTSSSMMDRHHPMVTRTQTGSLKPRRLLSMISQIKPAADPTSFTQTTKPPQWS